MDVLIRTEWTAEVENPYRYNTVVKQKINGIVMGALTTGFKLEITVKWAVLIIQRLYKASLSWLLWQKKGEPLFKTESRIQRGPLCSSQDLFRFFSRLKGPPPLLKCFRIMLNKRTKQFSPIYQSNNIRSNINQQFDTQSQLRSYQSLKRYQQFIIYQQ